MDLTKKCSPDIRDIDQTIKLYEGQKHTFIKSKILSGEYDQQLLDIALKFPIIPLLFFSGKTGGLVMREGYNENFFELTPESELFIAQLYGEDMGKRLIENIPDTFNDSIYETHIKAILKIDLINEDAYYVNLFEKDIDTLDEYTYCVNYYADKHYHFLYDYWFEMIKLHKEAYLIALNPYIVAFRNDDEEIVNIDDFI